MTMTLIETKTTSVDTASIVFTSIPQTFTDLLVLASSRSTRVATVDSINLRPNGLSEGSTRRLLGPNRLSDLNSNIFAMTSDNANTANTFGSCQFFIANYTGNTTKLVSIDSVSETNSGDAYMSIASAEWAGTAAITSLTFTANTGNLTSGTTISIYGILKGSQSGTVVT